MARCRCVGSGPCPCNLVAGDNVTVVGNGAIGSPWVISATASAADTIATADSPTVDMMVSGSGTAADPYVLSAAINVDPAIDFGADGDITFTTTGAGTADDPLVINAWLSCISCEAPGNPGDVLTLQPDGTYLPGPPNTVDPGAIVTSVGLEGDGTALDPLRVELCTYDQLSALCNTSGPTAPTGT